MDYYNKYQLMLVLIAVLITSTSENKLVSPKSMNL